MLKAHTRTRIAIRMHARSLSRKHTHTHKCGFRGASKPRREQRHTWDVVEDANLCELLGVLSGGSHGAGCESKGRECVRAPADVAVNCRGQRDVEGQMERQQGGARADVCHHAAQDRKKQYTGCLLHIHGESEITCEITA